MAIRQLPSAAPAGFDANLLHAIATNFEHFGGTCTGKHVFLQVRLQPGVRRRQLASIDPLLRVVRVATQSPFVTVHGPFSILEASNWIAWSELAASVELSWPMHVAQSGPAAHGHPPRPLSSSATVLAVIDDGCAFAHATTLAGPLQSRVFAIWDMSHRTSAPPQFGHMPADMLFGLEFWRAGSATPAIVGIDQWIAKFQTPAGSVDEGQCYAEAGFDSLRRRASHGTHVMDVLAGSIPPSNRMSQGLAPPTFARANDVAGQPGTDIIFVQLPREAVDDPSGDWLDVQVGLGLDYILSCLDPFVTRHLVVNLSYGPTTGPHDGTRMLEEKLAWYANLHNGGPGRTRLDIVLPSGNFHRTDAHIACQSAHAGQQLSWTWRVPPDNPVELRAQLWVNSVDAAAVTVSLLTPDGTPGGVINQSNTVNKHQWLLGVPATESSPSGMPGPHGDWTIQVQFSKPGIELKAYLARSDPNMGSRVACKPSRFVDAAWERTRGAFAAHTLQGGCRVLAGSLIQRAGAVNGIATGQATGVAVSSGYSRHDMQPASYSSRWSAGSSPRAGPDYALPTDESPALPGVRAAGTRSASTFRMVGTSTAAPQLGRWISSAFRPPACLPAAQLPDVGCGPLPSP